MYPSRSTETKITHAWSGILCNIKDHKPMVGPIKELPGQYISLGYTGSGMIKAFSCGRHIAELIAGKELSCPDISEYYSPYRFRKEKL